MGTITMVSLYAILPDLFLGAMALLLLMETAFKYKRVCNFMLGGTLFALGGTAWLLWPRLNFPTLLAFNGLFATSGFIIFSKLLILVAAALAVLMGGKWLKEDDGQNSSPTRGEAGRGALFCTDNPQLAPTPALPLMGREKNGRPSEFLVLMLLATLGMLLMVSANDFLTLYLALEMSSLALYVLAAFERDIAKSSEAGLKYFVLGALASGMLLFGMSLVYGFTGTTGFEPLARLFDPMAEPASRGVIVGMILIIVGFCFKLSAVPFHMWTPDVYEGAPTPVTAFFATASKVAAFALFARVLMHPFHGLSGQWQQIVIFVSIASMVTGALGAIMQSNIKRLLAYSSIGHAGYVLMGLAAGNALGAQAMLIYLALYIFMSAGAFGCVLLMKHDGQYVEEIKDLAGLGQTRPALAIALSIFMFSMAGIPPMAGFFAKLYVILAAISAGLAWVAVIGVIASVIGGFYYIKIVKVMYFDEPAQPFDKADSCLLRAGIFICASVTFLFFLLPTPLVAQAKLAAETLLH